MFDGFEKKKTQQFYHSDIENEHYSKFSSFSLYPFYF